MIPIIWQYKLQTETALSTFETEYIALSTALRDLLPFLNLFKELMYAIQHKCPSCFRIRTKVHEDNTVAEKLAKLECPRITPHSKHFGVKYHWFRTKLKPNKIYIENVDSKEYIADMFTKCLVRILFEKLRQNY